MMLGILLVSSLMLASAPKGACCGGMDQFADDSAFLAAHLTPNALLFKAQSGHMTEWNDADGHPTEGFYVPPKNGSKAAIVLVHEYWGLNDYIKRLAEELNAKTDYAVLAVDLYEGKVATNSADAGAMMKAVDVKRATAIVKSAVMDLRNGTFGFKAKKVGTLGFCFGGGWSLQAAIQGGSKVNACVVYYGMPDTSPDAMKKLKAPVLFVHAKKDPWINEKVVDDFAAAMKAAGHPLQVLHYDAVHAFANPSNPKYDQADADDAMDHTLTFFKAHF